jgi:hypothetical protein
VVDVIGLLRLKLILVYLTTTLEVRSNSTGSISTIVNAFMSSANKSKREAESPFGIVQIKRSYKAKTGCL